MKLPLLAAARPKSCKEGPVVPLPSGRWSIVFEHIKDTILSVLVNGEPSPALLVDGPCNVQVLFSTRGNEPYINVCAELQRGT